MLRRFGRIIRRATKCPLGIDKLMRRLGVGENSPAIGAGKAGGGYEILPASQYAKYALPVDYLPSRDFRPRYGNIRPLIGGIDALLAKFADSYRDILEHLRRLEVGHINRGLSAADDNMGRPMAAWLGGAMNPFDELSLYGLIGKWRPARIFEVGSGISTRFARQAIIDFKLECRLTSIDPEPRADIDAICDENHRTALEVMDIRHFDRLEAGDILFIDGSHRSFTNSDVTVFFIDILPRLKPGVAIHLHDITLPWDYPEMCLNWYWNEQYLLAVYLLAAGEKCVPLFPTAFVCRSPLFKDYFEEPFIQVGLDDPNVWRGGGSFWFTKAGETA